jgi:hypothetical protein
MQTMNRNDSKNELFISSSSKDFPRDMRPEEFCLSGLRSQGARLEVPPLLIGTKQDRTVTKVRVWEF